MGIGIVLRGLGGDGSQIYGGGVGMRRILGGGMGIGLIFTTLLILDVYMCGL